MVPLRVRLQFAASPRVVHLRSLKKMSWILLSYDNVHAIIIVHAETRRRVVLSWTVRFQSDMSSPFVYHPRGSSTPLRGRGRGKTIIRMVCCHILLQRCYRAVSEVFKCCDSVEEVLQVHVNIILRSAIT